MLVAFAFDVLDGHYARKLGINSRFGRQLDSFVDVLTYLVFAALLFHAFLSPNSFLSIIIGFLILSFGISRLIRFNHEGIIIKKNRKFYRGLTVVHISLIVLICYFLQEFVPCWNGWFSTAILAIFSPLMISNYLSYKFEKLWILAIISLGIAALALFSQYAH